MSTSQEMGKISVYQVTMGVIFGDANFVKNQAKSSELFSCFEFCGCNLQYEPTVLHQQ